MKYRKIVIAGGNGYLGDVLAEYYSPIADKVVLLSRKPAPPKANVITVYWDAINEGKWIEHIEGADLLINLCGKNVNCRYNHANKAAIIRSRVVPTTLLGRVLGKLNTAPALWINIASATIYRYADDRPQDEATGEIGYGFSVDVCKKWEKTFFVAPAPTATRKVALRLGIVMGAGDGVFPRLKKMVMMGLGGKQGSGSQYISWIHEQDFARCTDWLYDNNDIDGVVNCTAPGAISNADFMKTLRGGMGITVGLPAPVWLLEIGALIIGTETELILKSRWVYPQRLLNDGFSFVFPNAVGAVADIISIKA